MRTITVSTLKEEAEDLVAKAVKGEATIIELQGKRAVLMPCDGGMPDFELFPEVDRLLKERLQTPGRKPATEDWASLRRALNRG